MLGLSLRQNNKLRPARVSKHVPVPQSHATLSWCPRNLHTGIQESRHIAGSNLGLSVLNSIKQVLQSFDSNVLT
jgi:hypothetical protein